MCVYHKSAYADNYADAVDRLLIHIYGSHRGSLLNSRIKFDEQIFSALAEDFSLESLN